MNYPFFNQDSIKSNTISTDKTIEKTNRTFVLIGSLVSGLTYLSIIITEIITSTRNVNIILASIFIPFIVISIIVLLIVKNPKIKKAMKYILFCGIYIYCQIWSIYVLILSEKNLIIRSFYNLIILSSFFGVFLFRINTIVIIFSSTFTIVFITICQVIADNELYYIDLCFSILIPLGMLLCQKETYELIEKLVSKLEDIQMTTLFGINFINALPFSYFLFENDKLIFLNDYMVSKLKLEYHIKELDSPFSLCHDFLQTKYLSFINQEITSIFFDTKVSISTVLKEVIKLPEIKSNEFTFLGNVDIYLDRHYGLTLFFRKVKVDNTVYLEVIINEPPPSSSVIEQLFDVRQNILQKFAHEFKTPLLCMSTLIDDSITTMESNVLSNSIDCAANLNDLKNFINYILFLFNDIMNFLKIEDDDDYNKNTLSTEEQYEEFELRSILLFSYNILVTLLKYSATKIKKVQPLLEDSINCLLKTDSFRLKQVLLNLISNAVKNTKKGHIKIITEQKNIDGQKYIFISVQDTGIGIENVNNLLNVNLSPYYLYNHAKDNCPGLGLAICSNITKKLKWELTAKSILNEGSEFTIILPINTKNDEMSIQTPETVINNNINTHVSLNDFIFVCNSYSQRQPLTIGNPDQIPSPHQNIKKIMIIDDNKLIVDSVKSLISKVLKKYSITNIEFICGYDGSDLIKELVNDQTEKKICLTLLDQNMDYIDGNVAVKMIRELENDKRLSKSIICKMSAIDSVLHSHLYDYMLNKPFDFKQTEILLKKCGLLGSIKSGIMH